MLAPALAWAAPSCALPDTIAANAVFMAGKTPEIALCFYETDACLAYDDNDLPAWLSDLSLRWHMHLPIDLPWEKGAKRVADICYALWRKIAFLNPWAVVLHPPQTANRKLLLGEFAKYCDHRLPVLLENVPWCDIVELGEQFLEQNGFGLCLDVGHALGYSQKAVAAWACKASLLHWSAPCGNDLHKPLTAFSSQERIQAGAIMRQSKGIHVLEIFNWSGIVASLPILMELAGEYLEERTNPGIQTLAPEYTQRLALVHPH